MNFIKNFESFRSPYIDRRQSESRVKSIGDVSKNVEIRIDVEAIGHALSRQFRHGVKDDLKPDISEEDILDDVESAIEQLTISLMQDEFNINQEYDNYPTKGVKKGDPNRFVIRNKKNGLNIVCELRPGDWEFKLLVITVMRKDDFKEYDGQFVIEV